MRIFREKAGVISPKPVWVGLHSYFLYTHPRLIGLVWLMIREWKNERHIVG